MTQALTSQTLSSISNSHQHLLSMCEWCSISLPDPTARESFAQFRRRLTSLMQCLAQPPGKSVTEMLDWYAAEANSAKNEVAKIESMMGRVALNFHATVLAMLALTWKKLADGNVDAFAIAIREFSTAAAAASEKMRSIPMTELMAIPQTAVAGVPSHPQQHVFNIAIPAQPLDVTIHSPNIDVTVNPQLTTAPSKITRDASGKMIGIEPV